VGTFFRQSAQCAGVLDSLNIGINPMIQPGSDGRDTLLVLMLHDAPRALLI
jgi:hypothetical protein